MSVLALSGAVWAIAILVLIARIAARVASQPWALSERFALSGDPGDASTHLLLIDMIRSNGCRILRSTPAFLLSGPHDYPSVFHLMLSWISRKRLERSEWLLSPTIEAVHAGVAVLLCAVALSAAGLSNSIQLAMLIGATFALTPLLTRDPRRGAYLNERVFGFTFANIFFLSVGLLITFGASWALALALGAAALVAVSSKFSFQALVFITPVTSILGADWRPAAILAVGLALGVIASRGYALRVWKGTLRHSSFYARFLVKYHDYTTSFSLRQFADVLAQLSVFRPRQAWVIFARQPLVKMVIHAPAVWIAIAIFALYPAPYASFFGPMLIASVIVAAVTSTDWLKFLGEGERYLEVALLPAMLVICIGAGDAAPPLLGLLLLHGLVSLVLTLRRSAASARPPAPFFAGLNEWVAAQPAQVILTVPGRLCYPLSYHARQHCFMWWFTNVGEREDEAAFRRMFEDGGRYPFISPKVAAGAKALGADLVILDKAAAEACRQGWNMDYGVVVGEKVFENQGFAVIRPRRAR